MPDERVDAKAVLLHGADVANRQKPGTFWRLVDEIEVAEALDSTVAALRQTLDDVEIIKRLLTRYGSVPSGLGPRMCAECGWIVTQPHRPGCQIGLALTDA